MFDRGIGIAGLALAVIFGALQFFPLKVPAWVSVFGVGVGVLMLGVSLGLIWSGRRSKQPTLSLVDSALLRLHIFKDHRTPDRLEAKNIFRWYYLSHVLSGKSTDGKDIEMELPTLFVSFQPEVRITTLKVRSPDIQLPRHEVKEFNQKFAIIVFSEKISEGTLEVSVEP
ncbi:MAG: hypothetical protein KGQ68_07150 [Gammaproteobacteria bacterium]|nr:hypothetical protein [Gammaproteobacteria bacterium]